VTGPVIEVEGTAYMLEEEEEVVVVGRAVKLEEVEEGEIEVEVLERVGVESGAKVMRKKHILMFYKRIKYLFQCKRLKAETEKSSVEMNTAEDVFNEITKVKNQMNKYLPSDLYRREWVKVDHTNKSSINDFTNVSFLTFNILARGLSSGPESSAPFSSRISGEPIDPTGNKFGGFDSIPHPEICLDFDKRKWRLLEILLGGEENKKYSLEWDIIALQECDEYYSFFNPILSKFHYSSLFYPKNESSGVDNGYHSDGCALFYNNLKFKLVDHLLGQFQEGSQIYILATFTHLKSGRTLVLGTTHLKAKAGTLNEAKRTAQAQELCEMGQKMAQAASKKQNLDIETIPFIMMGDFNAEPILENSCQTDANKIGEENCEHTCISSILNRNELPYMVSAYPINPLSSELFTTWKTRGDKTERRIIDYIFYNNGVKKGGGSSKEKRILSGFECSHILQAPRQEDLELTLLPGFRHPSDHIHLGAKFRILDSR